MTAVFADASYYIALLNADDVHHESAVTATRGIRKILTTTWVLTEVADAFCRARHRQQASRLIADLIQDAAVEIVPPSLELFNEGLRFYQERQDKDWSLTDCLSFVVMRERGATEALAADRHFEQAGFRALLLHS